MSTTDILMRILLENQQAVAPILTSNQIGKDNEQRVYRAVQNLKPWWYVDFEWADTEEDHTGIDLWIRHVYMGWVPFQVKSSKSGLVRHLQKTKKKTQGTNHGMIACIISNPNKSFSDIIEQLEAGFRFERRYGTTYKRFRKFKKLKR